METLDAEFKSAVSNVTITGAKRQRAIDAHTEVRTLLEADLELQSWGIDTILIGSYARQTARYPGKDVDVFLRFTKLSARNEAGKVYAAVQRVLVNAYGLKDQGGRVSLQARSLKIEFSDANVPGSDLEFSIDAVPAVPWGEHWGIPNHDRSSWDTEESRWILTDPIQFSDLTSALSTHSSSPQVGADNAYRPIVRMLRQARHVHIGEERPGGLYTEVAAYYAWRDGLVSGSTWAELLAATLAEVSLVFARAASDGMLDPVLGSQLKPALETQQWTAAAAKFDRLARLAKDALAADKCKAAALWREILGTNDRGQVLPLPDGCNADGTIISKVAAVAAVGSNEPRGFA